MRGSAVALLVLAWGINTPTAAASQVAVRHDSEYDALFRTHAFDAVEYHDAPGETNNVSARLDQGVMVITDTAPIAAGTGCEGEPGDPLTVLCRPHGTAHLSVNFTDGPDALTSVPALPVFAGGRQGGVLLDASHATDATLAGGPGPDVIRAGTGDAL